MTIYKPLNSLSRKSFESHPFIELTENTLKTRRNLLITSVVLLLINVFELTVQSGRTQYGYFSGLSTYELKVMLVGFILYFTIYFSWAAWDEIVKWRFYLTVGYPKNTNPHDKSYQVAFRFLKSIDDEPVYHAGKLSNVIDGLHTHGQSLVKDINRDNIKKHELEAKVDELSNFIKTYWYTNLKNDLERIGRFERSFWLYGKQQRVRFFLVDIGMPILMAIIGLLSLI